MLDYFPLPDGRLLHPYGLAFPVMDTAASWIGQYQITQERRDRVVVRIVSRAPAAPGEVARVRAAVAAVVGPDVACDVQLVDEIPLEITGKFRVARSLVDSAYGEPPPRA
jgi:hypothetical protein